MGAKTPPQASIVITPQDLDDALEQFLPEAPMAVDTGVAEAAGSDRFGARGDAWNTYHPGSATPSTFELVLDLPLTAPTQPRRPETRDRPARRSHFVAAIAVTLGFFNAHGSVLPLPAPTSLHGRAIPTATAGNAPPVKPEAGDIDSIAAVLGQYRRALTELDSAAVAAVWPTVDRQALNREFNGLSRQEITFTSCQMSVNGALGSAACTGQALLIAKAGNRTPAPTERRWEFQLRKSVDTWRIEAATAK
jgi:hypothetical protein